MHGRQIMPCPPHTHHRSKLLNHARDHGYAIPAVNCTSTSTVNAVLEAAAKARSPVIIQFSNGGGAFFAGAFLCACCVLGLPACWGPWCDGRCRSLHSARFKHLAYPPTLSMQCGHNCKPLTSTTGKTLPNKNQEASILGSVAGAHYVRAVAKTYGVPVLLHSDHCAKKLLPWFDGMLAADEAYFAQHGEPLFSSHMLDLSEEPKAENIEICLKYLKRMAKINLLLEMEIGITGGVSWLLFWLCARVLILS